MEINSFLIWDNLEKFKYKIYLIEIKINSIDISKNLIHCKKVFSKK